MPTGPEDGWVKAKSCLSKGGALVPGKKQFFGTFKQPSMESPLSHKPENLIGGCEILLDPEVLKFVLSLRMPGEP